MLSSKTNKLAGRSSGIQQQRNTATDSRLCIKSREPFERSVDVGNWVSFYQIVVVVVAVDVDVVVVIDVDVVVDVVVIDVDVVVVVVIDVDVVNVVFVAVDVDVVVVIDVDVVIVVVVIVADVSDVGSRPIKMSSISDLESLQSKVKPQI